MAEQWLMQNYTPKTEVGYEGHIYDMDERVISCYKNCKSYSLFCLVVV